MADPAPALTNIMPTLGRVRQYYFYSMDIVIPWNHLILKCLIVLNVILQMSKLVCNISLYCTNKLYCGSLKTFAFLINVP